MSLSSFPGFSSPNQLLLAAYPLYLLERSPTDDSQWDVISVTFSQDPVIQALPENSPLLESLVESPSVPEPVIQETTQQPAQDPTAGMVFVDPDESVLCENPPPMVAYIFNEDPLIVYVSSFVSDAEIRHLLQNTESKFTPSFVYQGGTSQNNDEARKSENAFPDRDNVAKCIERRVQSFQEWKPGMRIESMSVQRYKVDGFFTLHYDAFGRGAGGDRISTFNVFLESNCTGGGTNFPSLKPPEDQAWCAFIECDGQNPGVTFKPIAGNAIYWENLREDMTGYEETLHAGLPVTSGTKIGLNIWTWYWPLSGNK